MEPSEKVHVVPLQSSEKVHVVPLQSSEKVHVVPLPPPEKVHVVPLHLRPDLLVPCADLVNSEWRRSQASRVHALQKSCQEFPVNLVLLRGSEKLLGHARLSRVVGDGGSLFLESVVVCRSERGKGLGRTLMEEAELYARRRGFRRLVLTTHDKQNFYAHLGYVLSKPVQNAGAMTTFVPMETLLRFSRTSSGEHQRRTEDGVMQRSREMEGGGGGGGGGDPRTPPPPTPPPPPPPPPPLLPLQSVESILQTLTETPYRDAKGAPIYWMHKDI